MPVSVKVADAEIVGEQAEVIAVLEAMGYGPNPLRPIFPILPKMRQKHVPSASEPDEDDAAPSRDAILRYAKSHPGARPVDVVRALGGADLRPSGETRSRYNRLFQKVYITLREERNSSTHGDEPRGQGTSKEG